MSSRVATHSSTRNVHFDTTPEWRTRDKCTRDVQWADGLLAIASIQRLATLLHTSSETGVPAPPRSRPSNNALDFTVHPSQPEASHLAVVDWLLPRDWGLGMRI